MKTIKYKIRTTDPIIISSESGNQFMVPTKEFIPGGVILGALAAKYLSEGKLADQTFDDLFVNGKVSYSNAYKTNKINEAYSVTYPLPLSIHHIKNNESQILDLMYSEPEEQTKPVNGFGIIEGEKLFKVTVYKSTNPHHERNYRTGSTKSGIFYNYESINKDQVFEGIIEGEENLIKDITALLTAFSEIRVGRSRSTEYGKVSITFEESNGNSGSSENDIKLNADQTISLTLLSDVILYNENGVSTGDIANLEKYLKEKISEDCQIVKSFLKTEEIENYVSVWKLKKFSEIALKAGSCLLLKVSENVLGKLKLLQDIGIGERKHEGFGRIAFGLQRPQEKLQKIKVEKTNSSEEPSGEVSKLVAEKSLELVKEYLNKVTAVEALKIVAENRDSVKKKITSSQIGRLEGFVKISNDNEGFIKMVKNLRKTSKDKLTGCNFNNTHLFNFLTEYEVLKNKKIKEAHENAEGLFYELAIGIDELDKINNKLYKTYFLTLFSAIRNELKGGKK